MATVYYDRDAQPALIKSKKVAILGYGSQGHAQAQNLRDSGVSVIIGVRPGASADKARADGFRVTNVAEAVREADIVHVLVPDEHQARLFREEIQPNLRVGQALSFSHGFNIHYGQVVAPPEVDVFMVAPKAPGHAFRWLYQDGQGVPGLLAVHQDATGQAQALGLAFAWGIGCTRAGVIETTFQEETESDLFGEQAVLCGGMTHLVETGFNLLVEAGYQPEIAYFECLNEMKLIVDLMYQGGMSFMRYSISDTAEYGDLTRGPQIIDDHVRDNMRRILAAIQDGSFARDWILENQAGRPIYRRLKAQGEASRIEEVGRELRAMMPWLSTRPNNRTAAKAGASAGGGEG
jgi:ketol-acid reductoisomerase